MQLVLKALNGLNQSLFGYRLEEIINRLPFSAEGQKFLFAGLSRFRRQYRS
jgi:hypothetical protein